MTTTSENALDARVEEAKPVGGMAVLKDIFWGPLPCTPAPGECRSAPLFRSSIALNYVTGGRADMTFSARCHQSRISARTFPVRLAWRTFEIGIDAGCRLTRRESGHCATALRNHFARRSG